MAALTAFVEALRAERGERAWIPDFDPWDGGVNAEVLYLLEAPGGRAVGSGFVSRNNPDETSRNFFELNRDADIPHERTVVWNVVPCYVGDGRKIRPVGQSDIDDAEPALERLLDLLQRLRAVVLVGRKAERVAGTITRLRPAVRQFIAPHPSPLYINAAPGNRKRLRDALVDVARILKV